MVSKRRNKRPTGNPAPVSKPCTMGQRPHPMVLPVPKDDRGWSLNATSQKDISGQPDLPADRSGFREERLGSLISSHLRASAEYIVVNVGGFGMDAKVSSPPMTCQSVGGPIVVGARESHVHGEGGQGMDVRPTNNRRSPWESLVSLVKWAASTNEQPMTADESGKSPIPGEPGAVKVACPVRKGGWGNTARLCALPLPYNRR
jgi:hypothetical protein